MINLHFGRLAFSSSVQFCWEEKKREEKLKRKRMWHALFFFVFVFLERLLKKHIKHIIARENELLGSSSFCLKWLISILSLKKSSFIEMEHWPEMD